MNISFEQGVQIDKFIKRFRAKDRVIGTVYIAISDNESKYGGLEDIMDIEEIKQAKYDEVTDAKQDIINDYEERLYIMSAEELFEKIDSDIMPELMDLYEEEIG